MKLAFPGVGPDADRQEASHPHQVAPHPSGKELLIPDLGSDKIWRLEKEEESGSWKVAGEIAAKPGYGPRHLVVKGEFGVHMWPGARPTHLNIKMIRYTS